MLLPWPSRRWLCPSKADIAIRKRTEKLRALRLAKEAADAANPPEPKAKPKTKAKAAKKGLT